LARALAAERGAKLIVSVGSHFNLTEFLGKDRAGMSSTFVTRLKVGEILVDAKGVSRLVSPGVGVWPLVVFAIAESPVAKGKIWAGTMDGLVQLTRDGGAHWKDMQVGRFSPLTYGRDIRVSPHDPRVMYACLSPAARSFVATSFA